jgi:hypothetical protein
MSEKTYSHSRNALELKETLVGLINPEYLL